MKSNYDVTFGPIPPQIRSVWTFEEGCLVSNSDIAKLNFTITLATDIILLLMMLAGLLYLRLRGGGMFSLGDFLWKQVGGDIFLFLPFTDVVPLNRGLFGFYLLLLLRSRQRSACYYSFGTSFSLIVIFFVSGVPIFEPESCELVKQRARAMSRCFLRGGGGGGHGERKELNEKWALNGIYVREGLLDKLISIVDR